MSATSNYPKPEILTPKPDSRALERLLARPIELDDRGIRLLCIPLFGVGIAFVSGLTGALHPGQAVYWLGMAWFIAVSAVVWHGNRFLYLMQRQANDWFNHPVRRIALMLAAIVFYTVPCSVLMLCGWYAFSGLPVDWAAIRGATLICVICVVFITHVYETVYLIRQRETDMVHFEKLERAKVQAELEALKAQLDPHFMFNSLNALSWLIENDPGRAVAFNDNLAEVYRYILRNRDRGVVTLAEEVEFLRRYYALLRLRFEDAIQLEIPETLPEWETLYLPPISLQTLLENAVKHNEFHRNRPLCPRLIFEAEAVVMENEIQPRRHARPSSKVGLENLNERCRLILGRDMEVDSGPDRFRVRLPLRVIG